MNPQNIPKADETGELRNEDPAFVTDAYGAVLQFLANNGWHIVFGIIVFAVVWSYVEPQWSKWKRQMEKKKEARELAKNPEKVIERQEALLMSRQVLQAKYDELAKEHSVKVKQKEEEKRIEKLEEWDHFQEGKGFHSKHRFQESATLGSTESKPAKSNGRLRPNDYNPLTGSGSGVCYRPARRGVSSGGG